MRLLRKFLAGVAVIGMTGSPIAQDWTLTTAPQGQWGWLASSADGKILAAESLGIYSSTNFGSMWTIASSIGYLQRVAMAADGTTLVASGGNGISVSTNSGATWTLTLVADDLGWAPVACSSDGKRMVATSWNQIYISTNSGADWTLNMSNFGSSYGFGPIVSSADGSRLAVAAGPTLYTSTNYGLTWTPTQPKDPTLGSFIGLATSGAGTTLLALFREVTYPLPGTIATSSDWGASWKPVGTIYNFYGSIAAACSADGATLVVAESNYREANPTRVSVSTNSGAAWSITQFSGTNLCSVTSSADGSRLALALSSHGIYVLQTTPRPLLKTLARAEGLQLSWLVPSGRFVLQESPDLSTWSDVDAATVFNYSNLNYEVELPRPVGPKFYRLSSR